MQFFETKKKTGTKLDTWQPLVFAANKRVAIKCECGNQIWRAQHQGPFKLNILANP
jgi:hypothetical protein